MSYGISHLSVVPVRAQPGDRHEQVSQLLFGEHFTVLETQEKWVFIQIAYDGYRGWIDFKQYRSITGQEFHALESADPFFTDTTFSTVFFPDPSSEAVSRDPLLKTGQNLVFGSVLPFYAHNTCKIAGVSYQVDGNCVQASPRLAELLKTFSGVYMNSPYQWGGRSPLGIDCSGLSQLFGRFAGVSLARDASGQVMQGSAVNSLDEAGTGDLAFFGNEDGKIVHVGILSGKNSIFHAAGQVRIDSLDKRGIYNKELQRYTHTLSSIRRI